MQIRVGVNVSRVLEIGSSVAPKFLDNRLLDQPVIDNSAGFGGIINRVGRPRRGLVWLVVAAVAAWAMATNTRTTRLHKSEDYARSRTSTRDSTAIYCESIALKGAETSYTHVQRSAASLCLFMGGTDL